MILFKTNTNGNLSSPVFPCIRPVSGNHFQGEVLDIKVKDGSMEPFRAQILTAYRYPSLYHISPGFLFLVAGTDDLNEVIRKMSKAYKDEAEREFLVLILKRI